MIIKLLFVAYEPTWLLFQSWATKNSVSADTVISEENTLQREQRSSRHQQRWLLLYVNTHTHTKSYLCSEIPKWNSAVCIPCVAICAKSLSGLNDGVFVIARALFMWHTFLVFVHVSSLSAAAAIHWCESGLARVVSLAEWLASAIAHGHVVAICCAFRAKAVFAWRGGN